MNHSYSDIYCKYPSCPFRTYADHTCERITEMNRRQAVAPLYNDETARRLGKQFIEYKIYFNYDNFLEANNRFFKMNDKIFFSFIIIHIIHIISCHIIWK
jgi:hypothetical protein